ncbi:DUF2269 family protein [Ignatzschineria sp. LJL83]
MFDSYFVLKYLHIISAMLMVGTGFGSALYVFFSNRFGNLASQYFTNRMVVFCDWAITTPAVIIQPITGLMLGERMGMSFSSDWFINVYILYFLIGIAWLPVVWFQIQMKKMTDRAYLHNEPLDSRYKRYQYCWESLGYIGFTGAVLIFYIMVTKMPFITF